MTDSSDNYGLSVPKDWCDCEEAVLEMLQQRTDGVPSPRRACSSCRPSSPADLSDNDGPRVELVHWDRIDVSQKAATALLAEQEAAEAKARFEGPPERVTESYGIIARKVWTGPAGDLYEGEIVGTLPGGRGQTTVQARTVEGLVPMAHRAYLRVLTESGICDAKVARVRAAEAQFYIATVM